MRKFVLMVCVFAILGASFIFSQEDSGPYSYVFNKKKMSGDAFYKDKTYDEVWAAIVKVLMVDYKILDSDKDSGIISAFLKDKKNDRYDLLVEKKEGGVGIYIDAVEHDILGVYSKRYKQICQKVAVKLYGEEVIPQKKKK
jgi:hypothetical protein